MRKVVIALVLLAAAAPVMASPVLPYNDRTPQVTVHSPGAGEPALQSILDAMFGVGAVNAQGDQIEAAMFRVASMPPVVTPALAFEYTSGAPYQEFGIWSGTDSTNLAVRRVFLGGAVGDSSNPPNPWVATSAKIQWTSPTVGTITGDCGQGVDCGSFSGINFASFGFYYKLNGTLFYTADSLNPGNLARALIYGNPDASDTYAIAFEDGSDWDYQDAVLKVESVKPIPEPGSMLLLGSGLFGLAGAIRRRVKK